MNWYKDEICITQGFHNGKHIDDGWHSYPHANIKAPVRGLIKNVEKQPKGGNVIIFETDTGIQITFAHLESVKHKKGTRVLQGEVIGVEGDTGSSCTGIHVDVGCFSKGKNVHGNSDLDPFKLFLVGNEPVYGKCKEKLEYKPKDTSFNVGEYRLVSEKALRKTPYITNNIAKVSETPSVMRPYLTSKNKTSKAVFKLLTDVIVRQIIKDKEGRTWGKVGNFFIVLIDKNGNEQAFRIK